MSDQNPTQTQNPTEAGPAKGTPEIKIPPPRCPHCGIDLPGMNISTMALPTQPQPMVFLLACCPNPECGRVIGTTFLGYQPKEEGVATPPPGIWTPH